MIDREITLVSRTKGTVVPLRGEEHTLVACTPSSPNSRPRAKRPFLKTSTPKLRNLIRIGRNRISGYFRNHTNHPWASVGAPWSSESWSPREAAPAWSVAWPGPTTSCQPEWPCPALLVLSRRDSCWRSVATITWRERQQRARRGEARRDEARRAFPSNHGQPRDVVT